jgi:predicted permease
MAWMKKTSGHHWATHTLLSLLVFIILGLILNKTNNGNSSKSDTKSLPSLIVSSVAIGAAIILGFYLFID